ncbi:MAG: RNA polymerase sigma factor, partial [Candidatus Kryptonium sp.]
MKKSKKDYIKLTDVELVKLAIKKDELAYVELMNRYKRKVESIVLRIVKRKSEVDDLVQAILTKAF